MYYEENFYQASEETSETQECPETERIPATIPMRSIPEDLHTEYLNDRNTYILVTIPTVNAKFIFKIVILSEIWFRGTAFRFGGTSQKCFRHAKIVSK